MRRARSLGVMVEPPVHTIPGSLMETGEIFGRRVVKFKREALIRLARKVAKLHVT